MPGRFNVFPIDTRESTEPVPSKVPRVLDIVQQVPPGVPWVPPYVPD